MSNKVRYYKNSEEGVVFHGHRWLQGLHGIEMVFKEMVGITQPEKTKKVIPEGSNSYEQDWKTRIQMALAFLKDNG